MLDKFPPPIRATIEAFSKNAFSAQRPMIMPWIWQPSWNCNTRTLASVTRNGLPVKQSRNYRLLSATHVRQSRPAMVQRL